MSDLRTVLHSAYTFVRSIEVNKATASLTLDHLIQAQIDRIKKGSTRAILDSQGASVGNRTAYLDDLDSLEKDLGDVIQAVNDAGTDSAKLAALGIDSIDGETAQ